MHWCIKLIEMKVEIYLKFCKYRFALLPNGGEEGEKNQKTFHLRNYVLYTITSYNWYIGKPKKGQGQANRLKV